MTKPPPQTKESIEHELTVARMYELQASAGEIASHICTLYEPGDAIYMTTRILAYVIGNMVRPEPDNVNMMLGNTFDHLRKVTIETIRAKQIGDAAIAKEARDGKVS